LRKHAQYQQIVVIWAWAEAQAGRPTLATELLRRADPGVAEEWMILYVKAKTAEGEVREAATAAALRSFDAMEGAEDAWLVELARIDLFGNGGGQGETSDPSGSG